MGIIQRGASAKELDMNIREKLRLLRKSAGYSQEYVAIAISDDPEFQATLEQDNERKRGLSKNIERGLVQKRVSLIENLQSHIMEHELKAWCKVLHITVAELHDKSIGQLTDLMLERRAGQGGKG